MVQRMPKFFSVQKFPAQLNLQAFLVEVHVLFGLFTISNWLSYLLLYIYISTKFIVIYLYPHLQMGVYIYP